MADYRLTQSGDEVQELLNQVTPNQQAIQGLQNDKVDKVEGKGLSDENFTANEKNKLGDLPTESELNTELGKKATIVSLGEETQVREQADQTLQGNIDAEETRAKAAEKQNADDIDAEETARIAADAAINAKIPVGASAQNQLADKQFVNQTVATATATFRGTYNLVNDLHLEVGATRAAIIEALAATISGADNNDYCFVQIPTATATPTEIAAIDRYKFNGSAWAFEYTLNNSGFTAAQWDAINSGITSGLVAKLAALPTNSDLTTLLLGKQDVINDLSAIRSGAAAGATAYQKPVGGIPGNDMSSAVQGSLAKAESAAPQSTTYTKTETDGLVGSEETRARAAEQANADDIDAIEVKIPSAATPQNQLADKNFVNSSIATNTANFKGSYNEVSDLQLTPAASRADIATALAGTITGADNNDYAFVQIPTAVATPNEIARVERYKFNGTVWSFEYELNNSGFTAAQWDAINSTITSGLVAKLSALPTNADLTTLLAGKQDVISDLQTIRSQAGAAAPQATTYTKQETDNAIDAGVLVEETRAKAAEKANADDIDAIEEKIPAAASAQNQLADKQFVNSSIATATAQFKGTYNLVSDLQLTLSATHVQVGTALAGAISGADNNDYCFVQVPAAASTPTVIESVDRYKFDGTDWTYEFTLNNSGFTQAQWDAINSAITSSLVTKLTNLPTNDELTTLLAGKQAVIQDLETIRSGAAAGATAYQKPVGGIPDTDLSAALQTALASFITKAVTDLTNYYLKSDTYSKNEVDQLIAAINQFELVSVQTLPTASASTMGKLYFVPSSDPQTQNVKDEYITLSVTENDTTTYYWEQIGSTDINLTNYYTKSQTDAAITAALNTALASYSTTTQVGTIVSTAITTALANYYTKTEVNNIANGKVDKLTMTGTGSATEDDLMAIDENGNAKDSGKKLSDLQLKVTDCAMLGGGFPTCSTAGGTAAKTVTISNFLLLPNCRISVLFQNAFTASNPTLSINGGTAIAIKHFGRGMEIGKVHANTILTMVYDGTYWQVIGIESMTGSTPSGAVDLALPSGLLWCEHNVGAASPYEDGLYFSWGNVAGHTGTDGYDFGTSNDGPYASTDGAGLTGNIPVNGTYDAARHNMGAPWRMPTQPEFQELYDNCDSEWTDEDGVAGRRFTSRINGNSIFFPASGFRNGAGLNDRGSNGLYWSASLNSQTYGYNLYFSSEGVGPANYNNRFYGFSVRAVQ